MTQQVNKQLTSKIVIFHTSILKWTKCDFETVNSKKTKRRFRIIEMESVSFVSCSLMILYLAWGFSFLQALDFVVTNSILVKTGSWLTDDSVCPCSVRKEWWMSFTITLKTQKNIFKLFALSYKTEKSGKSSPTNGWKNEFGICIWHLHLSMD